MRPRPVVPAKASAAQPELAGVLQALLAGVRPILGANFVGAYLQGSFAVGDATTDSDVDFVIVVSEDVPAAWVLPLQAEHVKVYGMASNWARHLEGSYFPREWLRDLDTVGKPLLYVDNGSRELERSAHDNTLVVRWVLREQGVTLAGPEPRELLGPVPAEALRRETLGTLRGWAAEILAAPETMNDGWYQPYAVLSFRRMLQTLVTGRVHSKLAGARWAKAELDGRWQGLIDRAWERHAGQWQRVGQPADRDDLQSALLFVQYALAVADRLIGQAPLDADA